MLLTGYGYIYGGNFHHGKQDLSIEGFKIITSLFNHDF